VFKPTRTVAQPKSVLKFGVNVVLRN